MDSSPLDATPVVDDKVPAANTTEKAPKAPPVVEPNGLLSDEYNADDEQEGNSFGYGWSYNEGLDSPEDFANEDEVFDEDAEYAHSGKPVGGGLSED